MAEGHDKEMLRRLDLQGKRLEEVEEAAVSSSPTEAEVSWRNWRARISGANANALLIAITLMAILAAVTALCVMSWMHMQDTRANSEAFTKVMHEGNAEFISAIKELTSVQREGNCLTRTKGQDPELCRSMAR